jgi:hypothetical protein
MTPSLTPRASLRIVPIVLILTFQAASPCAAAPPSPRSITFNAEGCKSIPKFPYANPGHYLIAPDGEQVITSLYISGPVEEPIAWYKQALPGWIYSGPGPTGSPPMSRFAKPTGGLAVIINYAEPKEILFECWTVKY